MRHKIFNIVLAVLCICLISSVPMLANNEEDPYKEIDDLNKRIEKLEKDTTKLYSDLQKRDKRIEELTAAKNKADSLRRAERDANKSNTLKSEIENLKTQNKNLADTIESLRQEMAVVQSNVQDQANSTVVKLQEQIDSRDNKISELEKELDQLRPFREQYLAELAKSVDSKWLSKPYSKIDTTELQRTLSQMQQYASGNKNIKEAANKLKQLRQEKKLYEQGIAIINAPFDSKAIAAIQPKLDMLENNANSKDKKSELHELNKKIFNYEVTVEMFQELNEEVKQSLKERKPKDPGFAWDRCVAPLLDEDENKEIVEAIKEIPFLEKQYSKYCENLKKEGFLAFCEKFKANQKIED